MQIHQALTANKYPNANTLAEMLEVSPKSIHRDLEFMRDRMLLPLAFSQVNNGYYYTEPVASFPTVQVSEGELFALVLAEKALQQYRRTPFEKPLLSAIRKMANSLPDTISLNLAELEQAISFRTSAESILDLHIFDMLARAAGARKQLKLQYRKPGQPQAEARVVDPYHLANINGEWFLFAYDHARQAIRTFVPSRIQGAELTGKTFERPARFSVEKTLQDSFGVHSGKETHQVVIRFAPAVADYIREKKWHPSQQLRGLKNGGVELELKLSSLLEIQRWILGWGGTAIVVKPRELAESIRSAAKAILQAGQEG